MAKRTRTDLDSERGEVDRLAAQMGLIITIVITVVGTFFTVTSITDIEFDNIPAFFGETTLTKFGLGLFFVHWGWGVKTDLDLQSKNYCSVPEGMKLLRDAWTGIAIFILVFGALFAAHRTLVIFQALLLAFICINLHTWRVILKQANPMARRSRKTYAAEQDFICLEKLDLVHSYMNARWQRYRFATLIALAALQLLIAIVIWDGFPFLTLPRNAIAALVGPRLIGQLPGMLFLGYVLVSSIWMATMRLRLLTQLAILQDVATRYRLVPVEPDRPVGRLSAIRARLASWIGPQ